MKTKIQKFIAQGMTINLHDELLLIRKKSICQSKNLDLLWRSLCSVTATSGSSLNAESFMSRYDKALRFDLLPKTRKAREKAILKELYEAGVPRMRAQKAHYLSENYVKVKSLGGPKKATKIMLSLKGKSEKQLWIRQFNGVGEKYSNDIWMNICDPDFVNAIALDSRVKNFAKKLGFDIKSRALEENLIRFAKECGLTGWELDRLIYNFGGLILSLAKFRNSQP